MEAVESKASHLSGMAVGQVAVIGPMEMGSGEARRLRAMGFCPGRSLRVLRRGRVMVVMVPGTRLALSAELAATIPVFVTGGGCPEA